jgi:DNA-binding ferritin-like protein
MKNKIIEILELETFNTSDEAGNNYKVVEDCDFDEIAEKIVKLFAISVVSNRRELLFAFIKDWKEEFKDENWDYLDFMAERFLSKQ